MTWSGVGQSHIIKEADVRALPSTTKCRRYHSIWDDIFLDPVEKGLQETYRVPFKMVVDSWYRDAKWSEESGTVDQKDPGNDSHYPEEVKSW